MPIKRNPINGQVSFAPPFEEPQGLGILLPGNAAIAGAISNANEMRAMRCGIPEANPICLV
jgi:hypothetical protein